MNMKEILGSRPLLVMYRDCIKAVPLMNSNKIAQENIRKNFRVEFEKMRAAKTEAEVEQFKDGIIRFMSNLSIYTVKQ